MNGGWSHYINSAALHHIGLGRDAVVKVAIDFRLCVRSCVFVGNWTGDEARNRDRGKYFGWHLGIHAPIIPKIGCHRDNIRPYQNPEYLLNLSIDG